MYKQYFCKLPKFPNRLEWKCKCGNTVPDDRNFCVQCDRERPLGA